MEVLKYKLFMSLVASGDILFLPCLFVGWLICWLDNFNIGHNF